MTSPVVKSVGKLFGSPRSPRVALRLNRAPSPVILVRTEERSAAKYPLGARLSVDTHHKYLRRVSSNNTNSPPAIYSDFESTRQCDALVQSPFRHDQYRTQRRKLYHQDSPRATLFRALSDVCVSPENIDTDIPEADPPMKKHSMAIGPHPVFNTPTPERIKRLEEKELFSYSRKSSSVTTPFSAGTPKLGKGGFGSVQLGKYNGELVAIKQLYTRDQMYRSSFFSELRNFYLQQGASPHPHIVRIITFDAVHNQIVMEYVGSRNLHQVLIGSDELFDHTRRLAYTSQVADALQYCHSLKLMHLDVKPTNILLTDGSNHYCKLGDFGSSRNLKSGTPGSYKHAGTLLYTAPEILVGNEPTTAADIYSLSLVMWQCLSRQAPFGDLHGHYAVFQVVSAHLRPDCTQLNLTHPKDISLLRLTEKCWVHKSELRPSASDLFQSLKNLISRPN